jgi:hypothetical protein
MMDGVEGEDKDVDVVAVVSCEELELEDVVVVEVILEVEADVGVDPTNIETILVVIASVWPE